VSQHHDIKLTDGKTKNHGLWKIPRQGVVLLDRESKFEIGCAEFVLEPRGARSKQVEAKLKEEILLFARQSVPEKTFERAKLSNSSRLSTCNLVDRLPTVLGTTLHCHIKRTKRSDTRRSGRLVVDLKAA
jgi:hypothetical protein